MQETSHPLTEALRSRGLSLTDARDYLEKAALVGQVGFAMGEKNQALLARFKAGREAFFHSLRRGASAQEMINELIPALSGQGLMASDKIKQGGAWQLKPHVKSKATKRWGEANSHWELGALLKQGGLGPAEIFALVNQNTLKGQPVIESWERADLLARGLSGLMPSILDGGSAPSQGTLCLEPEGIESALASQAQKLMTRFGLGNIRIGGMPDLEQSQAGLDSLAICFEELAKSAGLPERAMGLGGSWTVHINCPMEHTSGYCQRDLRLIALSPGNGWTGMAHEWFHAFDGMVANALGNRNDSTFTIPEAKKGNDSEARALDWKALRAEAFFGIAPEGNSNFALLLQRMAKDLLESLRHASEHDTLAAIRDEATEASIERMRVGLFERGYRKRIDPTRLEAARASFTSLCRELLDGDAGLERIASWRQEHARENAPYCAHFDIFLLAEKLIRDDRAYAAFIPTDSRASKLDSAKQNSALQTFALISDRIQATAFHDCFPSGYASSAAEMSARGFEGNCFLETPVNRIPYLTDNSDSTLLWPVGAERGAHTEKYRAFLAGGLRQLMTSGALDKSILNGLDPMLPETQTSSAQDAPVEAIRARLENRRAQGPQRAARADSPSR